MRANGSWSSNQEPQRGECLIASNQVTEGITDPETAEAIVVRCAVRVVKEEGYPKCLIASYGLNLVNKLNDSSKG